MKRRLLAALMLIIMLVSSQLAWADETVSEPSADDFDVAEWDEYITQRFAYIASTENLPYAFYKVVAEENSYVDYNGETQSYTSRSSKFTIEGSWISYFTVDYDLYDRGFTVYFNQEEKGSTIKTFLAATLMVVFGISREKADEFVNTTVLTYDGTRRSEFIYSDETVVFLTRSVIGGTEVIVSEREYFEDRNLDLYRACHMLT